MRSTSEQLKPGPARSKATALPSFLITIDTEGDNLWSYPPVVTTRNADYLERFQQLCEEHGLRPTWLTNHEMIQSETFKNFARDVVARDAGEIGTHPHAWDSPPLVPLTHDDFATHPYMIEYPEPVMREKVHALTGALEDALGTKMTSHRAGRWGFDERYAEILIDEGYKVDCSVTPLVNWKSSIGDPHGNGGPDYTAFPQHAYWLDPQDISRPGDSPLLEVPVTVVPGPPPALDAVASACDRLPRPLRRLGALPQLARRQFPESMWLRPTGHGALPLRWVVRRVLKEKRPYAEFMLHSSELMPGGSPTFTTEASIEKLYADLNGLFRSVGGKFRGATLAEYYEEIAS